MRRLPEATLPGTLAVILAGYWSACSVLIHRSFHSNAWDLGLLTQVIWNTGRGRPFEYSFRDISYAGDHWQPILLLFVPLTWVGAAPESLLIAQAVLLGAAVVPLYFAARAGGASPAMAALVCVAYGASLAVARAVSFDFHTEGAVPLLSFSAVYALISGKTRLFVTACLLLLTLKEDAPLLVLGLVLVAVVYFQYRRAAWAVAAVAVVYGAIVNLWLIPHYRGGDLNPLRERYGYLGDSVLEILFAIPLHPADVADHLFTQHAAGAVAFLVLASGGALLLRPVMLLAIAPLVVLPLLSDDFSQGRLELHYLVVPGTFALCCLAVQLSRPSRLSPSVAAAVASLASLIIAIVWSPLPPSFDADGRRFDVDHHARVSERFVARILDGAIVSAQSPFVPHLAERKEIFTFPRVLTAEYVLIDHYGPKPEDDLAAGYDACLAALPLLGFTRVDAEDGVELWRKDRAAQSVPDVPPWCSGQLPP